MNFPLYIARRYLIAKKSKNVINIISIVSICGVCVGTMALVAVLSFFNGLDGLIRSLFDIFDPELKISIIEGKTFTLDDEVMERIRNMEGVAYFTEVLEENAMLKYGDNTELATIKGVSEEFNLMTGIDSAIIDGEFILNFKNNDFAVVGREIAIKLGIGLNFVNPIFIYVPNRLARAGPVPDIKRDYIFPSGVFSIQDEVDSKYLIIPLSFARNLLDYTTEISALEIKTSVDAKIEVVKERIEKILGDEYTIKTKFEQHESFFKLMKSEKWAVFLILTFILIVASFNIIGSLTMLIIDKKDDIKILSSLGADRKTIRNIFLYEGWLISVVGAFAGIFLGILICLCQQWFGFVRFPESGTFIISEYPVKIVFTDIIMVLISVLFVGFVAAWYPAEKFSRLSVKINKQNISKKDKAC